MDWGLISGLAAMCGVVVNFIRIGRWQGNIETRVFALEKSLDNHDMRMESLTHLISRQNDLLTEMKVKLDLIYNEKKERRKNAVQGN